MTLSKENTQAIRENYKAWTIFHLKSIGKMDQGTAETLIELSDIEKFRDEKLGADQAARKILEGPRL